MITALVLASLVLVLLGLGLWPVPLELELDAKVDDEGAWALGAGVALGPLAFTGAARPERTAWAVTLFGRRLLPRKRATKEPAPDPATQERWKATVEKVLRFLWGLDGFEVAELCSDTLAHMRFTKLEFRLRAGFGDALTNGRLASAIVVLANFLRPYADIDAEVDWVTELRVDGSAAVAARFRPLVVTVDALRFTARQARVWLAERRARRLAET